MIARCCSALTVGLVEINADGIGMGTWGVDSAFDASLVFTASSDWLAGGDAVVVGWFAAVGELENVVGETCNDDDRSTLLLLLLLFSCLLRRRLSAALRMKNGIGGAVSLTWKARSFIVPLKIFVRSGLTGWLAGTSGLTTGTGTAAACLDWKIFAVGMFREFFWKFARRALRQFWLLLFAAEDPARVDAVVGTEAVSPLLDVGPGNVESSRAWILRVKTFTADEALVFRGGRCKQRRVNVEHEKSLFAYQRIH